MTKKNFLPANIFPDDIYLVSYPKSGNTWLRFLIGNILSDNQCDFTNAHLIMPDIHYNPEQCTLIPRPRFIKSHAPFISEYPRVVYLVRDGRDVAVSYYYDSIKFGRIIAGTPFGDFITMFHRGELDDYGIWGDHVHSWLDSSKQDYLLIRYEDMKQDAVKELSRITEFAGLSTSKEQIKAAVAASHFSRMKKLEKEQGAQFEQFLNSNRSIPFIRSGKVGESQEFFTPELSDEFNDIHGDALHILGYLQHSTTGNDGSESTGTGLEEIAIRSNQSFHLSNNIYDNEMTKRVEETVINGPPLDAFETAYQKIRDPKTKFSVREPNHFTTHRLKQLGFDIEEFKININDFQSFIKAVRYEENYPNYFPDNRPEKALEHYLAAELLQLTPSDIYLNVMNDGNPTHYIYSDLFGVKSHSKEMSQLPYLSSSENRLSGSHASIPISIGSVNKLAIHCGIEHLEGDKDIQFIRIVSHLLKPGGLACIVPLYLSNNYGILTDPEVSVRNGTAFEEGVMVYCQRSWNNSFGRIYDPEHLFKRVFKNAGGLNIKIIHITNANVVEPSCYVKYAMLLQKNGEVRNTILAEDYIKLADEKVAAGDIDGAIDVLFNCTNSYPDMAEVYQLLAVLMAQKQTYHSAREMLEKAIALNPVEAQLYNQLGTVCCLAGDYTASKAAYENALMLDPQLDEVRANLVELTRMLPDKKETPPMEKELMGLLAQLNQHIVASRNLTENLISMVGNIENILGYSVTPAVLQAHKYLPGNLVNYETGFHQDEGGFRWVAGEGQLRLSSFPLNMLIEMDFNLTCANANCYEHFPFETRVFLDDEEKIHLVFDMDQQTHPVKLFIANTGHDVTVKIVSSQSFVPARLGGGSPDTRELAVQFSQLNIPGIVNKPQANEPADLKLNTAQQVQARNQEEVNWWKHFIFKNFAPDRETSEKLFLDRFRMECTSRWNYVCDPLGFDQDQFRNAVLLDIGNGPCGILNFVPGNIKVGIDPNNKLYRENYILYNVEEAVRYITCPAESLPLPGESFDFVSCVNVLDHVSNPQVVLDEIIRVLKPGGIFFLSVDTRKREETSLVHPHAFDGEQFIEMAAPLTCLHTRSDQPCYDDNPVNKRFDGWFRK